jgi:4'-phosphopantetheinyl transferase
MQVSGAVQIELWTMRVDGIDEPAAARWLPMLDETERARAARFRAARHRAQYIAAHALLRAALSRLSPQPPSAWRFREGPRGKPVAWAKGAPADLSFNLSHSEGIVGLAAMRGAGHALGFDLEGLRRPVDLDVADRFFSPDEVAWLTSLAHPLRGAAFLRLWTLKEAFIKATGDGLSQDLASFSIIPAAEPRLRFAAAATERPEEWWFEQRILDEDFVAAAGLRRAAGLEVKARWTAVDPGKLGLAGLRD